LRGVKFEDMKPSDYKNGLTAYDALKDVADWLGFESLNDYGAALECEGRAIFKRARY